MRSRRGYSLVELLVAIVVMGFVMAGAMNYFIGQSRTFKRGATDMTLLQNVRFGADLLGQHFRAVGADVTPGQPSIIYAASDAFPFNADYATNKPGDLSAIYYTPNAPDIETSALPMASAFQVPGAPFTYPKADYQVSPGVMSPAEAISFWFAPDTETTRTDDYVLWRAVNGQPAEAIVRNILADSTAPFFRYYYLHSDAAGNSSLDTVPAGVLPLSYGEFGSKDTLTAMLRAIQISFIVTNGLTGTSERQRPFSLVVQLPLMGHVAATGCGSPPVGMAAPTASVDPNGISVDLSWTADGDETGGERDVTRYVIWRRQVGAPSWGDPYASVPAGGQSPYTYNDRGVTSGTTYEYAIAAQDCTPSFSNPVGSNSVTLP